MTRPAGYIRVSDPAQVERLSLATQEQLIRDHCARLAWPEPTIYREAGKSAYTDDLTKRPQFNLLVTALLAGQFDHILVYDLDRFARDTVLQLTVARQLRAMGCRIVSINQLVDLETPEGRFNFTINAGLNELYSAQISRKTKAGLAHIAADGGYVGGLSFGARRDAAYRRVVDPDRAADLRLLLTLTAELAYTAVAAELNRRGVRPAKSATVWRDTAVRSTVLASRWLLDQPDPWPGLWLAAATRPRPVAGDPRKTRRMLSGLMRCACGGNIVYSGHYPLAGGRRAYGVQCRVWSKERPTSYRCAHRKRVASHYEALMTRALLGLPDLRQVDIDPPDLRRMRADLAARRINLARAVAIGLPQGEQDALLARIVADEMALPLDAGTERAVAEHVWATQGLWGEMTAEERNDALRRLVATVVIEGERMRVEWVPPLARLLDAAGFPLRGWVIAA